MFGRFIDGHLEWFEGKNHFPHTDNKQKLITGITNDRNKVDF